MSQTTHPNPEPEVVPVGAVRLAPSEVPSRAVRNAHYAELGTVKTPLGLLQCYAFKPDGSLLFVMPDKSGFKLDTVVGCRSVLQILETHQSTAGIAGAQCCYC